MEMWKYVLRTKYYGNNGCFADNVTSTGGHDLDQPTMVQNLISKSKECMYFN